MLVIDEAHNLCSPELDSLLAVAVRERIMQIAAEGRKFGLWLLLSTQRPSKVHPGIISQCDNLALMRMSSPLDLEGRRPTSGSPRRHCWPGRPGFDRARRCSPAASWRPHSARVGERITPEGGSDVGVPLR